IDLSPPDAALVVDGQQLDGPPFAVTGPRQRSVKVLAVRDGYAPYSHDVALDDGHLVVALVPLAAASPFDSPPAAAPSGPKLSTPSTAPPVAEPKAPAPSKAAAPAMPARPAPASRPAPAAIAAPPPARVAPGRQAPVKPAPPPSDPDGTLG